jgi:hypothetical protein
LAGALLTAQSAMAVGDSPGYTKPKVRAITAFVRVEPASLDQQVGMALTVLRRAKAEFEKQGYATETLRIVTQPLAELVNGQSASQALDFLKRLDELSAREGFLPSVGPAMMRDGDDPRTVRVGCRTDQATHRARKNRRSHRRAGRDRRGLDVHGRRSDPCAAWRCVDRRRD